MSSIREFLSARDEYITRVKEELLGPGSEISIPDSEHELITNSPDVRYSIGRKSGRGNQLGRAEYAVFSGIYFSCII